MMSDNASPVPAALSPDPVGWEDPPRRTSPAGGPVLSIAGFEGPLDWLLEMVRAGKIDLSRLSILALIEAFAEALDAGIAQAALARAASAQTGAAHGGSQGMTPLWQWGDWLVMAAQLALLRSRLLLPADSAEAAEAIRDATALRQALVGRLQMGALADWLDQRPQLGQDVFGRGQPEVRHASHEGDLTDLLRACLAALRLPDDIAVYRPRPPALWRIADAMGRIRMLLASDPDRTDLAAFLPEVAGEAPDRELRCRAALASSLAAGLEMARGGELVLQQEAAFATISLSASAAPSPDMADADQA